MYRSVKFLKGILRYDQHIFFSKHFDHIEIVETTILFGRFIIKEETREAYLPDIETLEEGKLRVIAEAWTELHGVINDLRNEGTIE